MIEAGIKIDSNGIIYGFTVRNHGDELVCAAVSTLVINTVNSITELTETEVSIQMNEDDGFIDFQIEEYTDEAILLLKSLNLGFQELQHEHPKEFGIIL